ncbi:hypothetical protein PVAG01_11091 [Phlyctema vagabunda]|uniref:C2H2-type domain-containing protein n=1 Tax=Phlyctema vagabunda TaxID=108571 RepID=A0ABR4P1B2_9HELO
MGRGAGPSDNGNKQPKAPKDGMVPSAEDKLGFRLACPFRKHNAQKYNMHQATWKTCATSSFESVARTKEHIYRKHKAAIQCVRCWIFFKSQDDLNIHLSAINICNVRPGQPIEGVSPDMVARLRSRKKFSADQTEEDRWRRMYEMLFPNEDIPSPFFEPVLDDLAQSQEPGGTPIEEFMRQQLPIVLSRRWEHEVFNTDPDNAIGLLSDRNRLREFYVTRFVNEAVEDVYLLYRQSCQSNVLPTPPSSYQFSSSQTPLRTDSRPASLLGSVSHSTEQQRQPVRSEMLQRVNIQASESERGSTQTNTQLATSTADTNDGHVTRNAANIFIPGSDFDFEFDFGTAQNLNYEDLSGTARQLRHDGSLFQQHPRRQQIPDCAPLPIDWAVEFDQLCDHSNDQAVPTL